jgi:copper chaperone
MKLAVGGMTCPTCEASLERAIQMLPGIRAVRADHRSGSVEVEFEGNPDEGELRQAIEDAGYELGGPG